MRYEWGGLFERVDIRLTEDGEIENFQTILKKGVVDEDQSGQNVVTAVIEQTKNVGNLIHLELRRIDG